MLILSRRVGDSVVIDGGIRLVVLESDRKGVRIGIEAPAHVRILRGEIVADIAQENERATAVGAWLGALGLEVQRPEAVEATLDEAGTVSTTEASEG